MKVVHIIEALGGGVHTYFKDLSYSFGEEDIRKNVDTTIIYSSNRNEINPANINKEFSKGVKLIEIDMAKELSVINDLKSTILLYKELKKLNPDVVHLHSSKAGVIGRWASFLSFKKHKIFYTPHGYAFLREDISKSKQVFFKLIEKYSQTIFGGTTIACGDTEFKIAEKMGKSVLVRNGIDFNNISSFYIPVKNQKLTIGIVGRITFARNPRLFNEIALRFPNFQFTWIGDGDLRDQITAKNIKITGWKYSQEEVLNELNQIDIYLQTSIWEGLPIALLEAMALRKPIIATNVIGNKDIVVPEENGFLFDKIEQLNDIFTKLQNDEYREFLGNNGYKICEIKFDKNRNFLLLMDIYSK